MNLALHLSSCWLPTDFCKRIHKGSQSMQSKLCSDHLQQLTAPPWDHISETFIQQHSWAQLCRHETLSSASWGTHYFHLETASTHTVDLQRQHGRSSTWSTCSCIPPAVWIDPMRNPQQKQRTSWDRLGGAQTAGPGEQFPSPLGNIMATCGILFQRDKENVEGGLLGLKADDLCDCFKLSLQTAQLFPCFHALDIALMVSSSQFLFRMTASLLSAEEDFLVLCLHLELSLPWHVEPIYLGC